MSGLERITGRVAVILDVLDDRPISVRRLAEETGIPRSTAQRLLEALRKNGRAELTPRGWVAPSVETLFTPPEHKDFGERPAVRDAFANHG